MPVGKKYDLQLIQLLSTIRLVPSPRVGLAPPNKVQDPKLKHETL